MTRGSQGPVAPDPREQEDALSHRVLVLEERASYQTRLLEELSDVLHRQQQTMDALTRTVERLGNQLGEVCGSPGSQAPNERPPHY